MIHPEYAASQIAAVDDFYALGRHVNEIFTAPELEPLPDPEALDIVRITLSTAAVKAVFRDSLDRILFLQRPSGNWDLPGGLVEEDETPKVALARELHEELGKDVDTRIGKKIGEWDFWREIDNRNVLVSNYAAHIISGNITLSREHVDYQWASLADVMKLSVKNPSLFDVLEEN